MYEKKLCTDFDTKKTEKRDAKDGGHDVFEGSLLCEYSLPKLSYGSTNKLTGSRTKEEKEGKNGRKELK